MGAVGVEDLALGVQAGQPRPGERVGEEVPPGADIGGAAVLEELLPDLVVIAAAEPRGEGVQGGGAGQVVLGLQGAGGDAVAVMGVIAGLVAAVVVRAGAAVDENGLGAVLARPAQGDPLRRELGERVVGGGAVGQGEHRDRGNGVRILEGGQQAGVLGRPLDEDDSGTHLLQERSQGQGAGRRVVTDRGEMDSGLAPGALGPQGAPEPWRNRGCRARRPHSHNPCAAERKSFHAAEDRARSRTTEST